MGYTMIKYIECRNLTLEFEKNNKILDNINIFMDKGKIYGFVGRNGCGKTMLFRTICGFVKPIMGEVIVDGKIIGKDTEFIRNAGATIGEADFLKYMSGYENLKILAEIKNIVSDEDVLNVLRTVNLFEEKDKKYKKYSVGMKQKLRIAQAVMENPDIIILDEPFNGLDRESVLKIREYIIGLKEDGKTILLASHMSEDLEFLCDHVFEMESGRILNENI